MRNGSKKILLQQTLLKLLFFANFELFSYKRMVFLYDTIDYIISSLNIIKKLFLPVFCHGNYLKVDVLVIVTLRDNVDSKCSENCVGKDNLKKYWYQIKHGTS